MLAHSSRAALLGLVFVVVVLTPWRTNAQDTKITWDNAPAPTRKLYLTEEEFRELLPEKKRPDAGYCPVECSHTLNAKQPNGKPYVSGKWEVDKKTGKADLEYRPGRSTVEKGNPYYCNVSAVYRYAPPAAEQPRPEIVDRPLRRLDMFVLGSLNAPYTAQAIREWKERDAKTRTEQVQNPKSPFYKYRYIPDMGLGLDRNDMYVMTSTNGKSCQVFIELQSAKLWQRVSIFLHLEDGAVSQEQAIAIARESAHIIAKKAFGARPKLDKAKPAGEVGLLNTWITDKAGKTPEEDRRANRVTLGKPFHIVCTYKLPKDYDEISIGYTMTPGQDAVIASRERCKRVKDDSIWWKPLDPSGYRAIDSELIYSTAEKYHADGNLVSVRKTTEGTLTVSFLVDTRDLERPYVVGPGSWEFGLQMKAIKRGGPTESDREFEVSTTKVTVIIDDDPAFSAQKLKPAVAK